MFSKALCFPEKYQFIGSGNRFLISTVATDTAKAMLAKRGPVGMSLESCPALCQTLQHIPGQQSVVSLHHFSCENKVV